ncbi:CD180 antigen-like [Diadema antillarum]|uniref:CD180 antigen-like n=1 Tax=Diadema antillarum TaxID=105358 RepID=UPI003A8911D9
MQTVSSENHACLFDRAKRGVYCYNMGLSAVPRDLPGNTEILDLSLNNINALYNTSFFAYNHLKVLAIESNNISFIESGTFLMLSFLQSLDLSNNKRLPALRGDMFASTALTNVQLNGSNLAYVSDDIFRAMATTSTLGLRRNVLQNVSWTDCHNVTFLSVSLSWNKLAELSEQSFVMGCTADSLDLAHNPIRLVSPATISSLKVRSLDVSGILLSEKELHHLFEGVRSSTSITSLYIRNIGLTSLRPGLFGAEKGKQLRLVDIGWNELHQLMPRGFENLTDVSELALDFNGLEVLEPSYFSGYREIVPRQQREDFQYDICVVTYDEDEAWTEEIFQRGLEENLPQFSRLAIGDEALRLGMYYLDSVSLLVENSFKVVFLISAKALKNHMFLLKFRIALDHVNEVQMEKIVLVFLEEIPDSNLPFLVRLFLSDNREYLMWPRDPDGQCYFWEKLAKYMTVNRYSNPLVPP